MRKMFKKLVAIVLGLVVFAVATEVSLLGQILNLEPVTVSAETEADPFDRTKLTVVSRGEHIGTNWTFYNNGLLWVDADGSGYTSSYMQYQMQHYARYILDDPAAVKYVYWNAIALANSGSLFNPNSRFESNVIEIRFGDTFIKTSSNITDMGSMFYSCEKLERVNINDLNTSNVTDMSWMFAETAITSMNLTINTSKVKYMDYMFYHCYNLTDVNINGLDTSSVIWMHEMFAGTKVVSLDLSNLNTSNVTSVYRMFDNCHDLVSLDMSGCDLSKVTENYDREYMLRNNMVLHVVKTPKNFMGDKSTLYGGSWYQMGSDGAINRSKTYTTLPTTGATSVTLVKEPGHKLDNRANGIGTCSLCGGKVKYGDNNNDGVLSVSDAVMLKKHLAGDKNIGINTEAADVMYDGSITTEDAVKLMKKLAGMDVELGSSN